MFTLPTPTNSTAITNTEVSKPIDTPIVLTTTPAVLPTVSPTAVDPNTEDESSAVVESVIEETPVPVTESVPAHELPGVYRGIWISADELAQLPMHGPAWENVKSAANQKLRKPDLSDQNDDSNMIALAKALVYARTGEEDYRDEVREAIETISKEKTEKGGRTLALGRELAAYVIAADLINLPAMDPELDQLFREKLTDLLTARMSDKRTLISTNEQRPNNWGTHAGASRAAVAAYLWDTSELEQTAQVFKGWLGDREAYAGFEYGSKTWQCNSREPVGINPKGCVKDGIDIGGAQPEEMRRGGSFKWPPDKTGYAWESLQGGLVQANILHRAGYDVWEWEDRALLRAVEFLYSVEWLPEGDDQWQPWLINYIYDTDYSTVTPTIAGKNMGYTDWTHAPQQDDNLLSEE